MEHSMQPNFVGLFIVTAPTTDTLFYIIHEYWPLCFQPGASSIEKAAKSYTRCHGLSNTAAGNQSPEPGIFWAIFRKLNEIVYSTFYSQIISFQSLRLPHRLNGLSSKNAVLGRKQWSRRLLRLTVWCMTTVSAHARLRCLIWHTSCRCLLIMVLTRVIQCVNKCNDDK